MDAINACARQRIHDLAASRYHAGHVAFYVPMPSAMMTRTNGNQLLFKMVAARFARPLSLVSAQLGQLGSSYPRVEQDDTLTGQRMPYQRDSRLFALGSQNYAKSRYVLDTQTSGNDGMGRNNTSFMQFYPTFASTSKSIELV
jgi:hypothetical protein